MRQFFLCPRARLDWRVLERAVPADPAVGIGRTGTEANSRAQKENRRRKAAGRPILFEKLPGKITLAET
jgi:hypothetical protein